MKILSLDISSRNTGFCLAEINEINGKKKEMVINHSGNIIPARKLNTYAKMHYLHVSVDNILANNPEVDTMVIETQHMSFNPKTSLILARMAGAILLLAHKYNLKVYEYSATTIKKVVTGSGKAKKDDMIKAVTYMFDILDKIDDNEADAIGIAYTYLQKDYKGDVQ